MSNGFSAMIDDRPNERTFRVDRAVYTAPEVFEAEMARIFEGGWVYLCHESQVPEAGCFFAAEIGRQPVVVIRQKDGGLKAFINACSHRGALLTATKRGKAAVLTCRFHGWAYACDGRCVRIKNEADGYREPGFSRARFDLTPVPRLASYRGFVFASLTAEVPALAEHLGAARTWIDLLVEQSPDGLEVVPGSSSYTIRGNWKLQAENSVDGYHVSTVHRVFAATVQNRERRDGVTGLARTEGGRIVAKVPSGGYDLGNGHMAIWATHTTPEVRPIWREKARLERDLPAEHVRWILERGRNLSLFPNVMIMDNPSTQIRHMRPLSAERTEVTVYCIAPVGESAEARAARLRKFEDFYLTFGMATSDDVAALEDVQEGSRARAARWNGIDRGLAAMVRGADADASALGFDPASSSPDWEHETLYHGFWRRWRAAMAGEGAA